MDAFDAQGLEDKVLQAKASGSKDDLRDLYEAALLDWTDNYEENWASDPEGEVARFARKQIALLWYNYGRMEESVQGDENRSLAVYEKAIHDPFGCLHGGIYLSYVAACSDTKKVREIYLHGLVHNNKLTDEDEAAVWTSFLEWTNKQNSPVKTTLEELKESVKREMNVTPPSSDDEDDGKDDFEAPAESKASEAAAGEGEEIVSRLETVVRATITPELLIKRHSKRPVMLFAAPQKDSIAMSANSLTEAEIGTLEAYLGGTLLQIRDNGAWILDILQGLWYSQALKERTFDSWFAELKALHAREEGELNRKLEDPKVANRAQLQGDLTRHKEKSMVQLEVLHALVNEALLALLREQFEALAQVNFPSATMALFERIEAATVSASSKAHGTGQGNVAELTEAALKETMTRLQVVVTALLSVRLAPAIWDGAIAAKKGAPLGATMDPAALDPRNKRTRHG